MGRISKSKREKMTADMLEHLKGGKQYPQATHMEHVDKPVAGAGVLGSKLKYNTATEHHGRRTISTPEQKNATVVHGAPGEGSLYFDDDTFAFTKQWGHRVAAARKKASKEDE